MGAVGLRASVPSSRASALMPPPDVSTPGADAGFRFECGVITETDPGSHEGNRFTKSASNAVASLKENVLPAGVPAHTHTRSFASLHCSRPVTAHAQHTRSTDDDCTVLALWLRLTLSPWLDIAPPTSAPAPEIAR